MFVVTAHNPVAALPLARLASIRLPGIRRIPLTVRGHHMTAWMMSEAIALRIRLLGLIVVALSALLVTLVSLYVMQTLIQSGAKVTDAAPTLRLVDFIRVSTPPTLSLKPRKAEPPPEPGTPPPLLQPRQFSAGIETAAAWNWEVEAPKIDTGGSLFGASLFLQSGEYLPIVKVQPAYPRQALQRKLVGWVIVEFTVTDIGSVENPFVVENCAMPVIEEPPCVDRPSAIFDTAALRAAEKFKYKPRVVDNVPIATAGVRNKIYFELVRDSE